MSDVPSYKQRISIGRYEVTKTYFEGYGPEPSGWYNDGNLYLRPSGLGWRWECYTQHQLPRRWTKECDRVGWAWTQERAVHAWQRHQINNKQHYEWPDQDGPYAGLCACGDPWPCEGNS